MAIFIVLWPCLWATKLRCLQKNNIGHTKDLGYFLALVHLIPSLPGLCRNRVYGVCCSLPKRPKNRFKPVLVNGDNRRFRAYCPKKIYCSKISGFCYGLFRMLKFLSFREWSKKFRFSVKNQSLTQKMTEAKKL